MGAFPFHADEVRAQLLAGGGANGLAIRNAMPEQHQTFFALLPYLFVATSDAAGWPLATMLTGAPGFVHALDATTLRIDALPQTGDPTAHMVSVGREIGLVGIDLATRRRNRANGRIIQQDAGGMTVAIDQSFGNCPQYIQRRDVHETATRAGPTETFAGLDDGARALIARADTFFVASRAGARSGASGADISHRGGRPGFVHIEGDTLHIPDFRGNRFYNTLGNLLGEPRAGLLFVDFERGDLLHLQGLVEIDWSAAAGRLIQGAERSWHFHVISGTRRPAATTLRWRFVDLSPATERTGGAWSQPILGPRALDHASTSTRMPGELTGIV